MQRQRCFRTDSHDVETCSKLCAPNEGMSIGSLTNPPVCPHPATGLRATAFPRPIDPDDLRQVDSPGICTVEIADLEWSQIEWGRNPALHVRRAKKTSSRCNQTNCACCTSCSVGPARNCGRSGKLTVVCREYVAWSRRALLTPLEITWENLATYAT